MIGEKGREIGKQRAFRRFLHVAFEGEVALGLGEAEHGVERAEQLEIMGLLVLGALDGGAEGLQRADQDVLGAGDDKKADQGAENDDEFERLPKNREAAVNGIRPDHAAEDDDQPDDEKHRGPWNSPGRVGAARPVLPFASRALVWLGRRSNSSVIARPVNRNRL
jgi:hypothetical protein